MHSLFDLIPVQDMRITWATRVTLVRLCTVPVLIFVLWQGQLNVAGWLFVGAAVTDFLDGYIARARNERTVFGALLDVMADKLLMLTVLMMLLMCADRAPVCTWVLWAILIKEVLVLGGGLLTFVRRGASGIYPSFIAKMSMASEMVFVAWCLFARAYDLAVPSLLIFLVCVLIISSCVTYVCRWLTT